MYSPILCVYNPGDTTWALIRLYRSKCPFSPDRHFYPALRSVTIMTQYKPMSLPRYSRIIINGDLIMSARIEGCKSYTGILAVRKVIVSDITAVLRQYRMFPCTVIKLTP